MRKPESATVLFSLLSGLLLVYVVLPPLFLLTRLPWRELSSTLTEPRLVSALKVSLATSGISILIMTVLGVPFGYVLARHEFPGRRFVQGLVFIPLVLPPIVGGIMLLMLFGPYGFVGHFFDQRNIALTNNLAGIILAQVFVASPYVIITSMSAFASVDSKLEHAASILGASGWRLFLTISLPLAWPGIAAGIMLAWLRTLGEFGATLVMAYHPSTLPVFLWVQLTSDGLNAALPIAFVLFSLALTGLTLSYFFGKTRTQPL